MTEESKKVVDELQATVKAFREQHDREMAEIKDKGSASAETKAAVAKASERINELDGQLATIKANLREVETIQARLSLSPKDAKDKTVEHARAFFAMLHYERNPSSQDKPVIPENAVEQFTNYKAALDQYFRRGERGLPTSVQNALQIGSDPAGGYWVLPDTGGRIIQQVYESSPVRKYANVITIGTDRLTGINDLAEDDSGDGWVGDTATRPETGTPDIGKYEIPVYEQYAQPKAAQTLLDDASVDVEGWLAGKVSGRFARREAKAFVGGNGVAKPRGFNDTGYSNSAAPTATAWQRVEYTGTGASAAFAAAPNGGDVFIDTIGKMKATYLQGAIWAMNRTTKAAARKLKDSNGHYIMQPDFRDGFKEMIAGFEVAPFEDMPALAANSLSIVFANFGQAYQIVDRAGISVLRDPFTAKPWVLFYTRRRVGGDLVNFEAIKAIKFI